MADFSLSSFLGQLESPIKTENRVQGETRMLEMVRPSSDVSVSVLLSNIKEYTKVAFINSFHFKIFNFVDIIYLFYHISL